VDHHPGNGDQYGQVHPPSARQLHCGDQGSSLAAAAAVPNGLMQPIRGGPLERVAWLQQHLFVGIALQ
jgi:hypothetical protein